MEDQWCNLPKDILELISKRIVSIVDYLRLRAVCIPWRSSLLPNPRYMSPQSPWLMLPYDITQNEGNDESSTRLFYDIASSKIRKIELPQTCGKQYCGASKGWLMLRNGPDISLLNPITKAQIELPSLESSPKIIGVQNTDDIRPRLDVWPDRYDRYCGKGTNTIVQRIILTSNPTLDPDCIVMALFRNNWGLAFCQTRDDSWTILEAPKENGRWHGLIDAIFHNNLFYCFTFDEVKIYNHDGSKKGVLKIIIPLEQADYYLLEGNLHELILIAQHRTRHGCRRRDEFSIYKLGVEDGQPGWIEISGIGEIACFICVGIAQCFIFEGLRENIMYYAYPKIVEKVKKNYFGWHEEDKFGYDIKKATLSMDRQLPSYSYWKENVTEIYTNFGSYPTKYSRGLWFTPSLY